MSRALLALLMPIAQAPEPPVALQQAPTAIDWTTLPDLPYRQPPTITAPMHGWVAHQARMGKCPIKRRVDDKRPALRIEIAVLVNPEDGVRTSVPRAAGCPAVEQYAAGLVTGFARNNLAARTTAAEQWYRTTLTFIWKK